MSYQVRLCILLLTLTIVPQLHAAEDQSVRQAISDFRLCADNRDVSLADQVLHADFQNFYVFKGELSRLDKQGYIDMLRKELIGGETRTQNISQLQIMGDLAVATANFEGGALRFEQHISLVKNKGKWQVVNVMLNFAK